MPNSHQGSTPAGQPQTYDSDPILGQNDDGRLEILVRSHISLDFWHYYQEDANDPYKWVGPRCVLNLTCLTLLVNRLLAGSQLVCATSRHARTRQGNNPDPNSNLNLPRENHTRYHSPSEQLIHTCPTRCGNNENCGNDGYDCSAPGFENSGPKWWNSQAIFPTSDGTFVNEVPQSNCPATSVCNYNSNSVYPHEGVCSGTTTPCSCLDSWDVKTCGVKQQPRRLRVFFRGFDGLLYSVAQLVPGNSTKYSPPEAYGTLLE